MSSGPSGFPSVTSRLIVFVKGTAALVLAEAILYSYDVARDTVFRDSARRAILAAEAGTGELEEVLLSVEEGTGLLATTLERTSVPPREREER